MLPEGDATIRNGKVVILPSNHSLDRDAEIGPYVMPVPGPSPATSQVVLKTTYRDRADGYRRATAPLSWALAIAGGLVAVFVKSAPVFSLVTIAWMFSGFVTAWLVGWLVHTLASPDGTVIAQAYFSYRLIRKEQDYRYQRKGGGR